MQELNEESQGYCTGITHSLTRNPQSPSATWPQPYFVDYIWSNKLGDSLNQKGSYHQTQYRNISNIFTSSITGIWNPKDESNGPYFTPHKMFRRVLNRNSDAGDDQPRPKHVSKLGIEKPVPPSESYPPPTQPPSRMRSITDRMGRKRGRRGQQLDQHISDSSSSVHQ